MGIRLPGVFIYPCHWISMWYQETQLPVILCETETQTCTRIIILFFYTWLLHIFVTSRKQPLPDVYYSCRDEETRDPTRSWFGQSVTVRWCQNWKWNPHTLSPQVFASYCVAVISFRKKHCSELENEVSKWIGLLLSSSHSLPCSTFTPGNTSSGLDI